MVKRYNVRYAKKLHDLGLYLITNHSNEFSYTRLKNALEFKSVHTVENYTDYLNEAFLVFSTERFSQKVKEQMKSPKKVYAYDTGVINAVKFKTAPDEGRLIENMAAIELLRRGKEFYYYKTRDGKEVDFTVKEGLKVRQLLQVCYNIDNDKTKKREAKETFGGREIQYLPLWKWLVK
ncbi:MAG: ATP-binding protein [Planctomycetes bacterium]|nr:ATP-binding protein [Planctomycetota bacterium]